MTSKLEEIENLLKEIQSLMDDAGCPLAPALRRAATVAALVGDMEHRDLFRLHLDGVLYSQLPGPRHAPWENSDWNPRWDVRTALLEDRRISEDEVMAFTMEEFEQRHKQVCEAHIRAQKAGNAKEELVYFDLKVSDEKILHRVRRRVDTFLQIVETWVISQKELQMQDTSARPLSSAIFIGHGQSPVWRDLKDFIKDRLGLPFIEFNSESAAGKTTVERLGEMLAASSFAFLIMTAEDEHSDSSRHARENVVHEVGLFQGRLGFSRAIVLLEDGCKEFSNIFGLVQIRFPQGNIMAKSEEIRQVLEREGLVRP